MKERLISVFTLGALLLIISVMCGYIAGIENRKVQEVTADSSISESTTLVSNPPVSVSDVTVTEYIVTTNIPLLSESSETTSGAAASVPVTEEKRMPESTKEIIDKYTYLVNRFKEEKPAYKKKEYQELPEEHREFGPAVNVLLNAASKYMVSEENCEELVRNAGSPEIVWDLPVHNTEKGCVLTDYDAVSWAKCEDAGDGTYKLSFSLKEEVNPQPTPADTLIPVSAHGAVMQPVATEELMKEVDSITSSLPGLSLEDFSLYHHNCEFSCVYNPETDEVISITHHIVIDITADIKFFTADINGSARLLNEVLIYDIIW